MSPEGRMAYYSSRDVAVEPAVAMALTEKIDVLHQVAVH